MKKCPDCKTELRHTMMFCPHCSADLFKKKEMKKDKDILTHITKTWV